MCHLPVTEHNLPVSVAVFDTQLPYEDRLEIIVLVAYVTFKEERVYISDINATVAPPHPNTRCGYRFVAHQGLRAQVPA